VKDWTQTEKLQGEKEMIGFYVTGHPLDISMRRSASCGRTRPTGSTSVRRARRCGCAAF
jgi:DNA polymerase III alpha subunit